MRTAEALARLGEHQEAIERQVASARRLADAGPAHVHDLGRMRWELTRMLRAYQLFKHNEIFDPAIASGRLADVALARTLKARCIAAADAFRRYTLHWSARDVVGCWDEYVPALHAMADALLAHLAYERRHIARALEQVADTRHRA